MNPTTIEHGKTLGAPRYRVVGYAPDGTPRVWGQADTQEGAWRECKEALAEYLSPGNGGHGRGWSADQFTLRRV